MKIAIILGTRPEIIKMSPVIRACENAGLDFFILHTGQHYSYEMDKLFFEELGLPKPKYNLNIGSGSHAEQISKILIKGEKILLKEKPSIVLVQGDTNSVLGGALLASKMGIKIGHVEAGLRSYDRRMPEEINRVITDHISDYLFAPTKKAEEILLDEGIKKGVFLTGNTIVDATLQNLELANRKSDILGVEKGYGILTLHRPENVDNEKRFSKILKTLEKINLDIIFPIHPRTVKQAKIFNLYDKMLEIGNLKVTDPLGYLSFLKLLKDAKIILTDSGGLQEESCILKVPCVTIRENTERPETLGLGCNVLVGDLKNVSRKINKMLTVKRDWENPFGDGKAGEKIIEIIKSNL